MSKPQSWNGPQLWKGELFIGGSWQAGAGDRVVTSSPIDGSEYWGFAGASLDQADEAVQAAASAFVDWANISYDERLGIVNRFAELVADNADDLAELISIEMGKARWDAKTEVGAISGKAALSNRAQLERSASSGDAAMSVQYRGLGPVIVLGPFNFPGHLANGHIMPALLAGNTVVLKPSEQVPAFGEAMMRLWQEAGIPPGVINLVQGGGQVGARLVDHPETAGVFFTGGVEVGKAIHRSLAGRPHVQLALELGGNNPLVALEVEDPSEAARMIVRSAFVSAGQRCTCARRLITDDSDLVKEVVELSSRLLVGNPLGDTEPFIGPVVSAEAARSVKKAFEQLVEAGGVPLLDIQTNSDGPAYLSPGIVDMTHADRVFDEEIFGPVLQVFMAEGIDEAVDFANDTKFGLAAGVMTDNPEIWRMARGRIRAGLINWNKPTVGASGAAPFGGIGASGNHRPAGFAAAEYCSYPVASLTASTISDSGEMPVVDEETTNG